MFTIKKTVIICLILSCIAALTSCWNTQPSLPTKPEDTTLEFWITENVENVDFSAYDEICGWMGAREFLGSGYVSFTDENGEQSYPANYVSYIVSAYPDYADGGSYITGITIADPNVKLYGLTVYSAISEFDAVFENMGYEIFSIGSAGDCHQAIKDGIIFTFHQGRTIQIRAEISNREGIVF